MISVNLRLSACWGAWVIAAFTHGLRVAAVVAVNTIWSLRMNSSGTGLVSLVPSLFPGQWALMCLIFDVSDQSAADFKHWMSERGEHWRWAHCCPCVCVCVMDNTRPLSLSLKQAAAETAVSLQLHWCSLYTHLTDPAPVQQLQPLTKRNSRIFIVNRYYGSNCFPSSYYTASPTFNSSPPCVCLCFCVCSAVLSPCPVATASAGRCHSIYKGFAQCLMTLGDSLTDSTHKDEDMHEIHSICRSV